LKGAAERGLLGLKGHRSVGGKYLMKYRQMVALIQSIGIRASNYNAIPESGVEKLVAYLKEFATA
jgi:phosphoserine aminotransferase